MVNRAGCSLAGCVGLALLVIFFINMTALWSTHQQRAHMKPQQRQHHHAIVNPPHLPQRGGGDARDAAATSPPQSLDAADPGATATTTKFDLSDIPSDYAYPIVAGHKVPHKGINNINKNRVILVEDVDDAEPVVVDTPAGRESINFVVVGDWGGPGRKPQRDVAAAMALVARASSDAELKFALGKTPAVKEMHGGAGAAAKIERPHHKQHHDASGSGSEVAEGSSSREADAGAAARHRHEHPRRHGGDSDRVLLSERGEGDDDDISSAASAARNRNGAVDREDQRNASAQGGDAPPPPSPHHDRQEPHNHLQQQHQRDSRATRPTGPLSAEDRRRIRSEDRARLGGRNTPHHVGQSRNHDGDGGVAGPGFDFFVSTGDNVYEAGAVDEFDDRFQSHFEKVYVQPEIRDKVWFNALGNHDHSAHGIFRDVAGQVRYTLESPARRWWMPASYYAHDFVSARDPAVSVFIAFLDVYDVSAYLTEISKPQVRWLARRLAATRSKWRFVVGHRPGTLRQSDCEKTLVHRLHRSRPYSDAPMCRHHQETFTRIGRQCALHRVR